MMKLLNKLQTARIKLQSVEVRKSGENTFAKYKYLELGDFLPKTQEIFAEVGLCGVVSFTNELATLTIYDMDDGNKIEITSPMASAALKGCHDVQNIGAVETYQRRYLWVTAMEIVEHDAIDAAPPVETQTKASQTNVQAQTKATQVINNAMQTAASGENPLIPKWLASITSTTDVARLADAKNRAKETFKGADLAKINEALSQKERELKPA